MVNAFEFATAGRIVFGNGRRRELGGIARGLGTRALLVCGRDAARAAWAVTLIEAAGVGVRTFSVPGEPEIALVRRGAELARVERCELVVGLGGGSVIDAAKAVAALATNTRDALDYLEVIGRAQPLDHAPLPVVAVPTTAGTGAEVTRNAVLASPGHRVKVSLRSPQMLPRVALVDPELTHSLPPSVTAATGMDALTQLVEPFLSSRANPMTDALCRDAIPRAARALPRVFAVPDDAAARAEMALASLCGGLALANAGLGAVHGFAAPIGGMFSAPHGAVCAALLAEVMEENFRVAQERAAAETLAKFDELARLLTGGARGRGAEVPALLRDLRVRLGIPRLAEFGIQPGDLADIAAKAAQSSSMKGNPVPLETGRLIGILGRAF
jgi:alcohol dehydrogenase class IV